MEWIKVLAVIIYWFTGFFYLWWTTGPIPSGNKHNVVAELVVSAIVAAVWPAVVLARLLRRLGG